jgi:hypothetical protein
MKEITFKNQSHKILIEAIKNNGLKLSAPIMITANQFDKEWSISLGWSSTNLMIPKRHLNINELQELTDDDYGGKVIINKIWEAVL